MATQRQRSTQVGRDGYGQDADSYPNMDDSPPQPSVGAGSNSWERWTPTAQYARADEFTGVGGDYDPHAHGDKRSKIIDHPPSWDGDKPEEYVRSYLRWLKIWLATTKTQENQRGIIIWQATKGKLCALIEAVFKEDEKLISPEAPDDII